MDNLMYVKVLSLFTVTLSLGSMLKRRISLYHMYVMHSKSRSFSV